MGAALRGLPALTDLVGRAEFGLVQISLRVDGFEHLVAGSANIGLTVVSPHHGIALAGGCSDKPSVRPG